MARDMDEDSGRPFMEINHPAPGEVIRTPAHVAGYGIAFGASASGSGEELHLYGVPIVFA